MPLFCLSFLAGSSQTCCHKRAWQADEMPPPKLMSGIGNNHFRITTGNDSCQLYFDQGLRMIHGYWDFEGYRAFKHAAQLDSTAAMCQLGMAIIYYNSHMFTVTPEAKSYALKAKELLARHKATAKEHDFITTWNRYFQEGNDSIFRNELKELCFKYPGETEFQLAYAAELIDGYEDGKPTPDYTSCDSVLRLIIAREPGNFAAHHYLIHNIQDTPECEKGIPSAEVIASLAPNIGHIQHMPGHIWYYLGDYAKARTAFLTARVTDSLYLFNSQVDPVNHWNNVHNMVYLAFNDIEEGRYTEALSISKSLQNVEMSPDQFGRNEGMKMSYLVDQLLTNGTGDWLRSVQLASKPLGMGEDTPFLLWKRKLFVYYAEGMNAFKNNQPDSLAFFTRKLNRHLDALKKSMSKGMEYTAVREYHAKAYYHELLACRSAIKRDFRNAHILIDSVIKNNVGTTVGDPPVTPRFNEETKIEFLLMEKKHVEAAAVCEQILGLRRNSARLNYLMARIKFESGNHREAELYLDKTLTALGHADHDFPVLKEAITLKGKLSPH
jgi:tetratricopeptide (TPR) repeat protein